MATPPRRTFKRRDRLGRSRDFTRVYAQGSRVASRTFLMFVADNALGHHRLVPPEHPVQDPAEVVAPELDRRPQGVGQQPPTGGHRLRILARDVRLVREPERAAGADAVLVEQAARSHGVDARGIA